MNNVVSHTADQLRDLVQYAAMNYDVWRCLTSRKTRPKHVPDMNEYLGFFAPTLHASLTACVVTLYALYETRKDTVNFHQLRRELNSCGSVPLPVQSGFEKLITEAQPVWIKVAILRNEAIGHVTDKRLMKHTFEKANLSPAEMERLIRLSKRTLNYLGKNTRGFGYPFPAGASNDTLRVLQALSASRAAAR